MDQMQDAVLSMPQTLGPVAQAQTIAPDQPAPPPVIEVRSLSVWYEETRALTDVTFDVRKGEILAFIGPSGCGKTTALKCLNRMLDEVRGIRIEGSILLHGKDIYSPDIDPPEYRQKFGWVAQRPNPFAMSIFNNVAFGLRLNRYRGSVAEKVELERRNVESQLESLRNQVNPHFLFNSLNTLAALITTDPPQALQFTRQFSKVYRTLLEWGNEPLVSLRQELELAQAFVFLQQMRFGNNLTCTFALSDVLQKYCLPPFALQLLIENAIKHNIISDEKPLWIRVSEQDGRLWVENKFQKRGSVDESTGTGLRNLRARYALITPDELVIRADERGFCVSLPLISEA
jgi:ABC-type sugar transport system ATPase subunit